MCIRDSPYRLYFNGTVADSGGGGQITLGGPTPQDSPFLKAVSYTHLRAHETVLDLVCRLLLETKNTRNNKSHTGKQTDTHLGVKHNMLRRRV